MTKTNLPFNLSPKAVLAFLFPLIGALGAAVANWIITGSFDADSVRAAAAGLILSGLALIGAYAGKPGDVVRPVGPGSDDLLPDAAKAELAKEG